MKTEELLKTNTTHQMVDHSFYNCLAKSFLIVQLISRGLLELYPQKEKHKLHILVCFPQPTADMKTSIKLIYSYKTTQHENT